MAFADVRPSVLFVSHETTLTGAPIALLHLVRRFQEEGWNLAVATPEPGPISDLLATEGARIYFHPGLLKESNHAKLRELSARFDVVVANTIISWPAVRAAHLEKKPVLWYLHETLVAVRLIREFPQMGFTLELANLLVTPTRQTARIFEGITHTPIEVVPYGIPTARSGEKETDGGRMSFCTLGSVEPRKGQDILVEAIKRLPRKTREAASFRIVGRHLDRPFFAKVAASAAGESGIEFTGERSHAESLELLAVSDALICSSRDETMPITILEAMSLGKVIISTNVGGVGEWLRDEMNGLLVERENPAALARAIERCMAEPELVARLRAGAHRTFERHFTLEKFAGHFGRLLADVAAKPKARDAGKGVDYTEWIARFDVVNRSELQREVRQMHEQPLISILLPVYNPDLELLQAAIESVRRQVYERWEVCVADDASTDPAVRQFLEQIRDRDSRMKVILREKNGHISACTNSALDLATGDWCALLDQDDALAETALAFVALEIDQHRDARLIYSDEDKIDGGGARSSPFFKTAWDPELFLGQNYINHLGIYRTDLLHAIGGFREGFEGSQDYDLALRCVERLQPAEIRHIPRVLYHWRMAPGSLAEVPDAKPYAKEAARRALTDHLQRVGVAGRVEACPENVESHRVIYEVTDPAPLVTIIIPTRDRITLLRRCLESLRAQTDYPSFEIVIVDNGSSELETLNYFCSLELEAKARVLRDDGPFNFSRLNNLAAAAARGEILAFLNNDIEVTTRGWLTEMVSHAARRNVGAVGARLWYPDGTLQHGGVVLGLGGVAGHAHHRVPHGHPGYFNRAVLQKNCSAVTAACMLTRRTVFQELRGFDEKNLGVNFNDVDYCLRLRLRGFEVVWTPYANLVHHESASRGHHRTREEQTQFFHEATYIQEKYGLHLLRDPFYSPNLSLQLPGYEIACPPRVESKTALLSLAQSER